MTTSLSTPVVLILFRRPEETARLIEALSTLRPRQIFVIADGPRCDIPGEAQACAAARAELERISWPCDIFSDLAAVNLGLKRRVESGLDWVFSQVEEAIILEDDCIPHPSFFRFCEELLQRFRREDRVMTISGSSLLPEDARGAQSYRFSRYPLIWGWATWRRAWQRYDPEMRNWQGEASRAWLSAQLPRNPAAQRYWSYCFQKTREQRHTWDYAWTHACWLHQGLSVLPYRNLVTNIGFGKSASHTFDPGNRYANLAAQEMQFPLIHPAAMEPDLQHDLRLEAEAYSAAEFLQPMFRAIRAQLNPARRR